MQGLIDLSEAIDQVIADVQGNAASDTFKIASDLMGLITSRVINTGTDSDGSKFSSYSKNPLPTYFFLPGKLGKKKTTRGDEKKAVKDFAKKYRNDTSYKNWREFHGLQTGFKDFSFTNEMWKNMIVEVIETGINQNVYSFSSKDEADKKVMGFHQNRYEFMLPNQKEINFVRAANNERLVNALNRWLNG